MICLNCKKQIPDDSSKCPHCGTEVFHKQQIKKEISIRRWQRWVFYVLIIIIFLGMIGVVVKILNENSKLLLNIAGVQKIVAEEKNKNNEASIKTAELEDLKIRLEEEKEKLNKNLSLKDKEITEKIAEIEKEINEKMVAQGYVDKIIEIAKLTKISSSTIFKIKLADMIYTGSDSDKDGIIDDIEIAIGTDKDVEDTDDDGYSDKNELIKGFNPIGEGDLNADNEDMSQYKGKLVSVEKQSSTEIWYIGNNEEKYFLGIAD